MAAGKLESGSCWDPGPSCARRACHAAPGAPASSVRWAAGAWIRLRMGTWTPCSRKLWRERREAEAGSSAIGHLGDSAAGELGDSATGQLGNSAPGNFGKTKEK
jgi:hypothetical protein